MSALSGRSRTVESAVTDLPEPLSPTMARVSPGWRSKLTPRTASVALAALDEADREVADGQDRAARGAAAGFAGVLHAVRDFRSATPSAGSRAGDGQGGQQAGAAGVGEPGPGPVEIDREPAAEIDQQHQVHQRPGEPGDEALQVEPPELRDRPRPADDRHRAPVVVAERRRRASPERRAQDLPTYSPAASHRGEAGQRPARRRRERRHVADDEDLGMAREPSSRAAPGPRRCARPRRRASAPPAAPRHSPGIAPSGMFGGSMRDARRPRPEPRRSRDRLPTQHL